MSDNHAEDAFHHVTTATLHLDDFMVMKEFVEMQKRFAPRGRRETRAEVRVTARSPTPPPRRRGRWRSSTPVRPNAMVSAEEFHALQDQAEALRTQRGLLVACVVVLTFILFVARQ